MDTSAEKRQRAELGLFGRRANVSCVGLHGAGADGIWFRGCAVRSLPAAAPACRPSSLKPVLSYGISLWFGTTLIVAGVAVNLCAALRHVRLVRQLDAGEPEFLSSLTFPVATALFLVFARLAMAIYLVSVRGSADPPTGNTHYAVFAVEARQRIFIGMQERVGYSVIPRMKF